MLFNTTNYSNQGMQLNIRSEIAQGILTFADLFTATREASKTVTVVALVSFAASLILNFDPTTPLTCVVGSGFIWGLTSGIAENLETAANQILERYERSKKQ